MLIDYRLEWWMWDIFFDSLFITHFFLYHSRIKSIYNSINFWIEIFASMSRWLSLSIITSLSSFKTNILLFKEFIMSMNLSLDEMCWFSIHESHFILSFVECATFYDHPTLSCPWGTHPNSGLIDVTCFHFVYDNSCWLLAERREYLLLLLLSSSTNLFSVILPRDEVLSHPIFYKLAYILPSFLSFSWFSLNKEKVLVICWINYHD